MKTMNLKTIKWTATITLLAAMCLPAIGCDAGGDDSGDAAAEVDGVEGLVLRMQDDRVEGSFTRNEATIDFVLERDGGVRTALLSTSDGAPLLESVAEAGQETVTLFGGRAVLSGDPAGEPQVEGDPDAMDELRALPEGVAIAGLHTALEEAGVDPVLLGAEQGDDEVRPRLYHDGTYWNLSYNESVQVGTWGWITYTHIVMRHDFPSWFWACIDFQAGAGAWAKQCGYGGVENKKAYQFWGMLLQMRNPNGFVVKVRTF